MKRVNIIAYLIIAYVAAFMIWWMILLGRLETKNYHLQKQLMQSENVLNNNQLSLLEREYKQNKNQFIYEGLVFLALLAGSSFYVIRGIQREQKQNTVNKNFLLATTHELKTPLATTKLNLQTLLKDQLKPEIKSKLIDNSVNEVNRLNQLVDNILLASKLDTPDYNFELEDTNISSLINILISTHTAKEQIKATIDENIWSKTDSSSLKIILQNLLDNALKYSNHNTVEIIATKSANKVKIAIKDQGIGISDKEKKQIFKRFYRVEQEETRKTKGTGLGLYLVKEMSKLLNGTIRISDNLPKGSIFILEIPAKNG